MFRFGRVSAEAVKRDPGVRRARCPRFVHGDGPQVTKARWAKGGHSRSRRPTGGRKPPRRLSQDIECPDAAGGLDSGGCMPRSGDLGSGRHPTRPWPAVGAHTWEVTPCGPGIRPLQPASCAILRRYARSIRGSGQGMRGFAGCRDRRVDGLRCRSCIPAGPSGASWCRAIGPIWSPIVFAERDR